MTSGAGVRAPFVGIGSGVIKNDGTVTVTRLVNAYEQSYQTDPEFESSNIFPRIHKHAITNMRYAETHSLIPSTIHGMKHLISIICLTQIIRILFTVEKQIR